MAIVELRPRTRRRRRVRAFVRWFFLTRVELDLPLVFLALGFLLGVVCTSVAFFLWTLAQ